VFIKEKFKRQQILDEIEVIDKGDDDDDILHENKRVRRIQLLSVLRDMSERDIVMIMKKPGQIITKGDMNSKFFHSRLIWRRLNNGIKGTFVNGEWCEDLDQVKIKVRKHFENRFQA